MKKNLLLIALLLTSGLITRAQSPWLVQNSGFDSAAAYPFDIAIADANTAWAVAAAGNGTNNGYQQFTHTTDGGNTWVSGVVTNDTNLRFSCVQAANGDTAWAMMFGNSADAAQGIYRTNDGGLTWNRQNVFTISSFPDFFYFWTPDTGMAFGDPVGGNFEIFTTTDGGTTWNPVTSTLPAPLAGEYGLTNDYAVVGDVIWGGTNFSRVYKSTDRGMTWTAASVVNNVADYTSPVTFRDANNGFCIKTNTTTGALLGAFNTTDGGATWTQFTPTGVFYYGDIKSIPGTDYYVSCSASTTLGRGSSYSTDDGASWTLLDSAGAGTTQGYTQLQFLDFQTGWAGGFTVDPLTDGIYKWDPTILSVKNLTPKAEQVAYPNPSTGVFNFNMPLKHTDLNISVFDAIGKEIYKTQFKNLSGIFKQTFDFTYLAKGVYYMVVDNGKDRTQEKLIIQ